MVTTLFGEAKGFVENISGTSLWRSAAAPMYGILRDSPLLLVTITHPLYMGIDLESRPVG